MCESQEPCKRQRLRQKPHRGAERFLHRIFAIFLYGKDVSSFMKKIVSVTGMHCKHCAKSLEEALAAVPGVVKAKADHEKALATVTMKSEVDDQLLIGAVEKAGFTPGEITIKEGLFS